MKNTPNRHARILTLLEAHFQPKLLELKDDSQSHHGHAGASPNGETHYILTIEAETFKKQSRVQAHQAIYALLQKEFDTGLHALSINARAPKL